MQGSFRIYCKYNNLVQLLYRLYERAYYLVVASERGDDDYVHTSLSTCSPHMSLSEESTAQHVRQRDHLVTLHFVTCYICLRSESVRHADLARVSTYGIYCARVFIFVFLYLVLDYVPLQQKTGLCSRPSLPLVDRSSMRLNSLYLRLCYVWLF